MGMPGYFHIRISSTLENDTYTRSMKFLGGMGLTSLSASYYFEDNKTYHDSLTTEEVEQSKECERKFFARLVSDLIDLPDGKHKIVSDKVDDKYKYILYDKKNHENF